MAEPTRTDTVRPDGSIEYRNADGELHREDGPAITHPNGAQWWYQHDKLHREDGPAVVRPDGIEYWLQHGRYHRTDGPARVFADGSAEWWIDGERRFDIEHLIATYETSVRTENADGSVEWRDRRGVCHRDEGPAYIDPNGYEAWFWHGDLHRVDGPAITQPDGTQWWYLHGVLHRTDGPALIVPDGLTEWWIYGRQAVDVAEAIAALTEETKDD